jgi:hypothetical protein
MSPQFISDEDMAKLEQAQAPAAPKFISDADMAKMEQSKPVAAPPSQLAWYDIPGRIGQFAGKEADVLKSAASGIGEDYNKRVNQAENSLDMNPVGGALNRFGSVAGFAGDVVGRGLGASAGLVGNAVKAALPEQITKPVENAATAGLGALGRSPVGQTLGDLSTGWEYGLQHPKEQPQYVTDLQNALAIGSMVPAEKPAEAGVGLALDAAGGAARATGEGVGDALQGFAQKGRQIAWKPSGTPEQVAKKLNIAAQNDIWGKAKDAAVQTNDIIATKYANLKNAIDASSDAQGAIIDPMKALQDSRVKALVGAAPDKEAVVNSVFDAVEKRAAKDFGYTAAIDPNTGEVSYSGGKPLDLADAQMYKQKLGEWADDAFDVTQKGKSVTGQPGNHQAYMSAYDTFKKQIEDLGPPGIKEQNQELSKLLDLRRDMRKRASVQARNNFIPLDEVVSLAHGIASAGTGNVLPLGLYGAQVASKSGGVGRAAYNLGALSKSAGNGLGDYLGR